MKQKAGTQVFAQQNFSLRWCLLVYLCLTGVNLVVHNRLIDSQPAYKEKRMEVHQQVMENKAPAPIQYRIMGYYAAELFQKMGASFQASFLIFRGISIFLAAWMFHLFLLRYFPSGYSLLGVVILLACMPMTYINYYMQESDAMNLFFYISAFMLIRSRKDWYLFPLIAAAMLNRETPVLIPLVWLLFRWDELPIKQVIFKFSGMLFVALGVYAGLRYVFGNHESYSEFFYLKFNLTAFNTYLYFFLFFGPFIYFALKDTSSKPKFIRRTLLFIPFFIMFHISIPIIQEMRLLLPLFPMFIPAALCIFYRPEEQDVWSGFEQAAWLKKMSRPLYVVFIIMFAFHIWGFYSYIEKSHVGAWRTKDAADKFLRLGHEHFMRQDYEHALRAYENGLREAPDNFDLHFNMGLLYANTMIDKKKAMFHWNKCFTLQPEHPRIKEVLSGLEKLRHE